MASSQNTSIDPQEIQNFAKDSSQWWDEKGPFKPLHKMNPVRMQYIRTQIIKHFDRNDENIRFPLEGLKILDIGCGGGLACESMAHMGADISGIDADENAIAVAIDHAAQNDLDIAYHSGGAEKLLPKESETYDVVLALEIIEHVSDLNSFIQTVSALCKPGGLIIFSTLNRTPKSFALGIVAAEYLLRWVPRGTHNWKKFIKPSELAESLRQASLAPKGTAGIVFNPLNNSFELSDRDLDVNYFMTAEK